LNKIGHAGTLDPMAEGLVIILLNNATKLASKFLSMNKEYNAVLKLGVVTDTWDMEGKIVKKEDSVDIKKDNLENVVLGMKGVFEQQPPIYSAKKIKGRPAYYYARNKKYENKDILLEKESVNIYEIEILSFEGLEINIRVLCSSGTYIRSLAYEIGNRLGCGATLTGLVRSKIGNFSLAESIKTGQIRSIKKAGDLQEFKKNIISIDRI